MSKQALCIGINDYPGTRNDLAGCVNDANDWAEELTRRGFTVTRLLDAQATRSAMRQAIADLIAGGRDGDNLVITYSGHGTWVRDTGGDEPDGRDEALCPYDIGSAGALLDDELGTLFGGLKPGARLLLLSDSCHSGSVSRGKDEELDPGAPRVRFLPPADWLPADALPPEPGPGTRVVSGLRRTGGDLLLAACKDTEYSYDSRFRGRPNGAFTYYALKTLRADSPASYDAWFNAIRRYLPSASLPQTPQILGSGTARSFPIFG